MFEGLKNLWGKLTGQAKPAKHFPPKKDDPFNEHGKIQQRSVTVAPVVRSSPPRKAAVKPSNVVPLRKNETSRNETTNGTSDGSISGLGTVADAVILGSLFSSDAAATPASEPSTTSIPDSFTGGGGGDFGGGGASGSWDSGSSGSSYDSGSSSSYDSDSSSSSFDIDCSPSREALMYRSRTAKQAFNR